MTLHGNAHRARRALCHLELGEAGDGPGGGAPGAHAGAGGGGQLGSPCSWRGFALFLPERSGGRGFARVRTSNGVTVAPRALRLSVETAGGVRPCRGRSVRAAPGSASASQVQALRASGCRPTRFVPGHHRPPADGGRETPASRHFSSAYHVPPTERRALRLASQRPHRADGWPGWRRVTGASLPPRVEEPTPSSNPRGQRRRPSGLCWPLVASGSGSGSSSGRPLVPEGGRHASRPL